MIECLITGCALYDEMSERCAWGDLHQVGDCYIFNAVLKDGETLWNFNPQGAKVIHLLGDSFERRGVFVIHKTHAQLNDAANAYIKRSPAGEAARVHEAD